MVILRRLHGRWRLAVMIPPSYMIGGMLISTHYFKRGGGLLEVSDPLKLIMLVAGAAFAILLWHLLTVMFRRQRQALEVAASGMGGYFKVAREQQMLQFLLCDLAVLPGIVIFLCTGDLFHLFMFIVISMFFYLRCFPSGRKLGEPLFHRG
ncbi:hypothetical protein IT570_06585 [Candidatus Sumerlaeota bacterium]|nr:hypothetical protein [Candidatus Sumerlaeota bacterium]